MTMYVLAEYLRGRRKVLVEEGEYLATEENVHLNLTPELRLVPAVPDHTARADHGQT